jgi:hypothetical protein
LLREFGWGDCSPKILTAGEALPGDLVVDLLRKGAALFNLYGPTETCVYSIMAQIVSANAPIPIGRPVANTTIYLLDSLQHPVPISVPGELYIGGSGVARGYLGRPDATAERFLPDPFSSEPGSRVYRTGDIACYRPDGFIDFLGRRDHQIKIRGVRLELGEIESNLREHPAVHDAVVVARQTAAGESYLVAFVEPNQGQSLSSGILLDWLRRRLPQYSLPSAIALLESLPLTPNEKIDRSALPSVSLSALNPAAEDDAVESPTREILKGIWADLLDLGTIHSTDNFFLLGGHSLLASQLVSKIRKLWKIELPLRVIFESPNLRSLGERIDKESQHFDRESAHPLGKRIPHNVISLSFGQERLWFIQQMLPSGSAYQLSAAIRLNGTLKLDVLRRVLGEVVGRHEALRTRFEVVEERPVQVIDADARFGYELIDLCALDQDAREAEVKRLAAEEAALPFDLERGPLLRTRLLRLGEREHVLLASMHHIVSDGWSMGVLVREFCALYEAFSHGRPSPLPPLPIQYADFAVWQREWLSGGRLEEQLGYWREQLRDLPPAFELPFDHRRPAAPSYRGATLRRTLDPECCRRLRTLCREEGVTLYMLLLAAFQLLLYRYSGQPDVVVGSPIANRNRSEIEPLIGFFVNTLVLRTGLGGNPTFRQLLARVREVCLGAYAHQDLPFEKLVEELRPARELNRQPLFQVMFAVDHLPVAPLPPPGLSFNFIDIDHEVAKFDLSLSVSTSEVAVTAHMTYNADLFEADTISRIFDQWCVLLDGICSKPDGAITDLPLILDREMAALASAFSSEIAEFL